MHHNEHENNMNLEAKWFELQESRKALFSGEALGSVTAEVFKKEKNCACCMDERVANREILGGQEVGERWNVAGSGILLPVASWKERAKAAASEAHKRGVTILTHHDGCGAAGLAVKQDLEQFTAEEKEQYTKNSDLYGQKFVEIAQEELNKLNKEEIKPIHVSKKEVLPFEFHAAIGATIDSTGEFNAYKLPAEHPLKYTFNIDSMSGASLHKDIVVPSYYLNEVLVAIRIAVGHHGFGEKFSKENPFALVVVGENSEDIENTKKQIKLFLKDNQPEFIDIVKFVDLVKPEHKKHIKPEAEAPSETQVEL